MHEKILLQPIAISSKKRSFLKIVMYKALSSDLAPNDYHISSLAKIQVKLKRNHFPY